MPRRMHAPATLAAPPIVPIAEADPAAIEALLDAAFGVGRKARTAYRLRASASPDPARSFAVHEGARLVATIQCWPVALTPPGGTPLPLILVGPVAVHPDRQRRGLGQALMARALAADDGRALMLIGDAEYYARFGFSAEATGDWTLPGPVERHRLLARVPTGLALPAHAALGPAA